MFALRAGDGGGGGGVLRAPALVGSTAAHRISCRRHKTWGLCAGRSHTILKFNMETARGERVIGRRKRPDISVKRGAEIFLEMAACRREFAQDDEFFKMSSFWEWFSEESDFVKIKLHSQSARGSVKRASIVAFDERVTLITSAGLFDDARRGCKFSNFVLAHELGHYALGHNQRKTIPKNFQLANTARGLSIIPPNVEEHEADRAAVFFQCGYALFDETDARILADRAYSEVGQVRKAMLLCRVPSFRKLVFEPRPRVQRVVL